MSQTFQRTDRSFPDPGQENIIHNPDFEALREFSEHFETTTEFGSPSYVSDIKSRSATYTKNEVDHKFDASDEQHIERALEYAHSEEMVCLDRVVGRRDGYSYVCRYYVPKEYGRIALSWAKLLDPAPEGAEPDFVTVQIPDWDETKIRVFPDRGETFVLGSDYTGEAKMSFLRLFLYHTKQAGGLGLHAGAKRVKVRSGGELREVGQLYLGLSATGKTTLTSHGLWLEKKEHAEAVQDDIAALLPDGAAAGSEGGGLYIKTIGLEPDEQPELYRAVTRKHAVLENVTVAEDGTVDFDDESLTRNGRATVLRDDLDGAADDIDLETVDHVFFITRNPMMPPVAKLTHEQAAVAFMLGESIQTSAGDPTHAGEAIRVVGTNPFIIGSKGEEGNRFYDLIAANDIDCFVLNTGHVGVENKTPIEVEDTIRIIKSVSRGTVSWHHDTNTRLQLPTRIDSLDIQSFYPPSVLEDYDTIAARTRQDRKEHLAQFDKFRDDLAEALY